MAIGYFDSGAANFDLGDPLAGINNSGFTDMGDYVESNSANAYLYIWQTYLWSDITVKFDITEDILIYSCALSTSPSETNRYSFEFDKRADNSWAVIVKYDGATSLKDAYAFSSSVFPIGIYAPGTQITFTANVGYEGISVFINGQDVGYVQFYSDSRYSQLNTPWRTSGQKFCGLIAKASGVKVRKISAGAMAPHGDPAPTTKTLFSTNFTSANGAWNPSTSSTVDASIMLTPPTSHGSSTVSSNQGVISSNATGGITFATADSSKLLLNFSHGFGIYYRFKLVSGSACISLHTGTQYNIFINGTAAGAYAQAGVLWTYYSKGTVLSGTYSPLLTNGNYVHLWVFKEPVANVYEMLAPWNGTGKMKIYSTNNTSVPDPRSAPLTEITASLSTISTFGIAGDNTTATVDDIAVQMRPMGPWYSEGVEYVARPIPRGSSVGQVSNAGSKYLTLPNASEVVA